jgi:hypothetical protein
VANKLTLLAPLAVPAQNYATTVPVRQSESRRLTILIINNIDFFKKIRYRTAGTLGRKEMIMNGDSRTSRFTPIAAILAATLALASLVSYLFWPDTFLAGGSDFYLGILRHTALFRFTYLSFALSALASLALVLAMSDLLQTCSRDLLRWISLLGIVGFSVVALHFFSYQNEAVRMADKFADQAGSYEGYGIYADPTASGELLVAPFPPESTEGAGFEKGDLLIAVNGNQISKDSTLQELWDGPAWDGSDVTLTLRGADGAQREVVLASKLQSYWNLEVQQAISAIGEQALDRNLVFGFGLVGLWLIVINGLAWSQNGYSRILALIGAGAGLAYWAFAAGNQFNVRALSQTGLFTAIALLPTWLAWAGSMLRKVDSATPVT